MITDLEVPKGPSSIAAAQERANACGETREAIKIELMIRADGTVTKSTVVGTSAAKTKLSACVAAAYRPIVIRALPPRALTLRLQHGPNSR